MNRVYAFGPVQYFPDNSRQNIVLQPIDDLVPKIISGEYRGLSVGYKVRRYNCSLCDQDIEECPHEIGKKYDGVKCQMVAADCDIIDISVVDVPKDPRCRIIDLLCIEDGMHPKYTWYGFAVNNDGDRFVNIQNAKENGWIPNRAALFFAEFFSVNLDGKAVYR